MREHQKLLRAPGTVERTLAASVQRRPLLRRTLEPGRTDAADGLRHQ